MDPHRLDGMEERLSRQRKKKSGSDDEIQLEKKDIPALIISALLVFGPILLVLALLVALLVIFVL